MPTHDKRERWHIPPALRARMVEGVRDFRKEPTPSEALLWRALRGHRLAGYKFRRQQPIGPFVVDFYCPAARLIVEVDGPIHEYQRAADAARQALLESLGLRFLRFSAAHVEQHVDTVLAAIAAVLHTAHESDSTEQAS